MRGVREMGGCEEMWGVRRCGEMWGGLGLAHHLLGHPIEHGYCGDLLSRLYLPIPYPTPICRTWWGGLGEDRVGWGWG